MKPGPSSCPINALLPGIFSSEDSLCRLFRARYEFKSFDVHGDPGWGWFWRATI